MLSFSEHRKELKLKKQQNARWAARNFPPQTVLQLPIVEQFGAENFFIFFFILNFFIFSLCIDYTWATNSYSVRICGSRIVNAQWKNKVPRNESFDSSFKFNPFLNETPNLLFLRLVTTSRFFGTMRLPE